METKLIALRRIASLGYKVKHLIGISGGVNSRVYKLETHAGEKFALKIYPIPTQKDPRNRCKQEHDFLTYIDKCKINKAPKIILSDPSQSWTLLSWINADKIIELNDNDILHIAEFIAQLNKKQFTRERLLLNEASEAYLSQNSIATSMQLRVNQHLSIRPTTELEGEVYNWIRTTLKPLVQIQCKIFNESLMFRNYWGKDKMEIFCSPSDVGIHNTLKSNSELFFIDFEYGGKDDLSKLVADWVFQPDHPLRNDQSELLINTLQDKMPLYSESWIHRYTSITPITILKWCMILINKYQVHSLTNQQWLKAKNYFSDNWTY